MRLSVRTVILIVVFGATAAATWDSFNIWTGSESVPDAPPWPLAHSPSGRWILTKDNTYQVINTEDGKTVPLSDVYMHPVFSPDNRRLVYARNDGTVVLWDLNANAVNKVLKVRGDPPTDIAFSSDGGLMITRGPLTKPDVWDCDTGIRRDVQLNGTSKAVFSMDGQYIIELGDDMQAVRTADGKLVPSQVKKGFRCREALFFPTGDLVALAGEDLRISNVPSLEVKTLVLHPGKDMPHDIDMDPSGRFLAIGFSMGDLGVWDAATGNLTICDVPKGQSPRRCSFSHDGKLILSAGGGKAVVWDVESSSMVAALGSNVREAQFNPLSYDILTRAGENIRKEDRSGVWKNQRDPKEGVFSLTAAWILIVMGLAILGSLIFDLLPKPAAAYRPARIFKP